MTKASKNELRIRDLPEDTMRHLGNMADAKGLKISTFVRAELIKIVESYPASIRLSHLSTTIS